METPAFHSQFFQLEGMKRQLEQYKKEADAATDPVVKAAFTTIADETKKRYEVLQKTVAEAVALALAPK